MNNISLMSDTVIAPFMKDVIMEIARKHPDWVLSSLNREEARRFTVFYSNGVVLGHIGEEYAYTRGERRRLYTMENWRISEMRQRGSGIQTSKPKEALKAVEKYFYPLTTDEYVEQAFSHAQHLVYSCASEAQSELILKTKKLQPPMMAFVHEHWDTFLNTLDDVTRGEALNLLKHQQLSNAAKALYKEVDDKKCLTVHLSNGKYTVQQGEVLQEYESDTLPQHIKTKVGLLKLVENRQVVPEVGVRVDDLYVVRP